jgi:hypothetical protein
MTTLTPIALGFEKVDAIGYLPDRVRSKSYEEPLVIWLLPEIYWEAPFVTTVFLFAMPPAFCPLALLMPPPEVEPVSAPAFAAPAVCGGVSEPLPAKLLARGSTVIAAAAMMMRSIDVSLEIREVYGFVIKS